MVYIKKFLVISFIVFLSGCATLGEKGKTFEEFKNDMERDKFMSAQEALEYGLIDEIIEKRP